MDKEIRIAESRKRITNPDDMRRIENAPSAGAAPSNTETPGAEPSRTESMPESAQMSLDDIRERFKE